jgi:hypothetical protein
MEKHKSPIERMFDVLKIERQINPVVDEESITNTFEETFKKFEV